MLKCWSENPDNRPTFSEILDEFNPMLHEDVAESDPDYINYCISVDAAEDDNSGNEEDVKISISRTEMPEEL